MKKETGVAPILAAPAGVVAVVEWAGAAEADQDIPNRKLDRMARRFWNGFRRRRADACLKYPRRSLSTKFITRLQMSYVISTASATPRTGQERWVPVITRSSSRRRKRD